MSLILVLALLASVNAKAHDWFPLECCGGNDCKEITKWEDYTSTYWKITNADGTFFVKKDMSVRPSKDSKRYLCVNNGKIYCLFAVEQM